MFHLVLSSAEMEISHAHSLLQGIFLTQGSKPGLPHCRQILYHLSHQGSPKYPGVCVCVCVCVSCSVVCDPMDCSMPGTSVHGILQARILEWVVMPFSRRSSQPRDRTQVSHVAGRFFTIWANGEAQKYFKSGAFNCTDVLKRRQKCWKSSEVLLIGLQLAPCFLLWNWV